MPWRTQNVRHRVAEPGSSRTALFRAQRVGSLFACHLARTRRGMLLRKAIGNVARREKGLRPFSTGTALLDEVRKLVGNKAPNPVQTNLCCLLPPRHRNFRYFQGTPSWHSPRKFRRRPFPSAIRCFFLQAAVAGCFSDPKKSRGRISCPGGEDREAGRDRTVRPPPAARVHRSSRLVVAPPRSLLCLRQRRCSQMSSRVNVRCPCSDPYAVANCARAVSIKTCSAFTGGKMRQGESRSPA